MFSWVIRGKDLSKFLPWSYLWFIRNISVLSVGFTQRSLDHFCLILTWFFLRLFDSQCSRAPFRIPSLRIQELLNLELAPKDQVSPSKPGSLHFSQKKKISWFIKRQTFLYLSFTEKSGRETSDLFFFPSGGDLVLKGTQFQLLSLIQTFSAWINLLHVEWDQIKIRSQTPASTLKWGCTTYFLSRITAFPFFPKSAAISRWFFYLPHSSAPGLPPVQGSSFSSDLCRGGFRSKSSVALQQESPNQYDEPVLKLFHCHSRTISSM